MWVVCVALKEDLFQSVICYCKHSLARNTPPNYKGCIRNLGSNPKGLTILHLHIIDTAGFMEWTWNMYDSMKKDGVRHQSRQLKMWHSFVRSQAPPCKGILPLSVHPQPQDHVPKCQEPPDISSSFHFWSNSWWTAKHVSTFRELERGTGSWWEDCAMWGKPIMLRHKKNHWNGKWHQKDMHWISFQQENI